MNFLVNIAKIRTYPLRNLEYSSLVIVKKQRFGRHAAVSGHVQISTTEMFPGWIERTNSFQRWLLRNFFFLRYQVSNSWATHYERNIDNKETPNLHFNSVLAHSWRIKTTSEKSFPCLVPRNRQFGDICNFWQNLSVIELKTWRDSAVILNIRIYAYCWYLGNLAQHKEFIFRSVESLTRRHSVSRDVQPSCWLIALWCGGKAVQV